MTNCPVCNTALSENLCPSCGYDRSRDYALFPTFAPVPVAQTAPRKQEMPREDVIRCSKCGGTSFSLQAGTMLPVCRRCGTVFTPAQPEKPKVPILPLSKKQKEAPAPQPEKQPKFQFKKPEPSKPSADKEAAPSALLRKLFSQKQEQPAGPGNGFAAIAGGFDHTAALLSDGHVRAVGSNEFGQCDTRNWSGIHTICAGTLTTLSVTKDGRVLAAGWQAADTATALSSLLPS